MKQLPVSPSFLKQRATKLKREKSIKQTEALDIIAKEYGYENYRHYTNISNSIRSSLKVSADAARENTPVFPTIVSGSFKNLFKDIYDLIDQPTNVTRDGLVSIVKNDNDPYRRALALENLVNVLKVNFSATIELIHYLPTNYRSINYRDMIWRFLSLEDGIETALYQHYLDDAQSQYEEFSTHSRAEGVYLGGLQYTLTAGGKIKVNGDFDLSVDLQYGSDGDVARDSAIISNKSFPAFSTALFSLSSKPQASVASFRLGVKSVASLYFE